VLTTRTTSCADFGCPAPVVFWLLKLTADLLRPVLSGIGGGWLFVLLNKRNWICFTYVLCCDLIPIESMEYLCVVLLEASIDQDTP
jgi:hypothetical protein